MSGLDPWRSWDAGGIWSREQPNNLLSLSPQVLVDEGPNKSPKAGKAWLCPDTYSKPEITARKSQPQSFWLRCQNQIYLTKKYELIRLQLIRFLLKTPIREGIRQLLHFTKTYWLCVIIKILPRCFPWMLPECILNIISWLSIFSK